jgi:hypothetical protein
VEALFNHVSEKNSGSVTCEKLPEYFAEALGLRPDPLVELRLRGRRGQPGSQTMTGVIGKVDANGNHYRLQFIFQSKTVLRTPSAMPWSLTK